LQWNEDLKDNPIGAFAFGSHTLPFRTLDLEQLSVKNLRRQDAATVRAAEPVTLFPPSRVFISERTE